MQCVISKWTALVTSGELHCTYELQVASVEILMNFNMASCLGAVSVGWGSRPQFTQIPCEITVKVWVEESGKLPASLCSGLGIFY